MNVKEFIELIEEELHDSKNYAIKAIEIKAMSTSWGEKYLTLSKEEFNHATILFKMFQEFVQLYMKENGNILPEYIEKYQDKITQEYAEKTAYIKHLHSMY